MNGDLQRQFQRVNRLGDEIVAATQDALGTVSEIAVGRNKYYRGCLILRQSAQFFTHFKTRQFGHVYIQQYQVVTMGLKQF